MQVPRLARAPSRRVSRCWSSPRRRRPPRDQEVRDCGRRRRRLDPYPAEPVDRRARPASAATTRCRRWPPRACIRPTSASPSAPGLLRRPVRGADHAELDRDPVRPRRRDRHAAAERVDEPRRRLGGRVQRERRARGLVRRRRDQPDGVQRARAGAGRARRAACSRKAQAYLRGQQHTDGGWNFGRVATDAQRAAASSTDMTGAVLAALCETGAGASDRGRARGPVVPRRAAGPGDRRARQRRLDRLGGVGAERLRRGRCRAVGFDDVGRADAGGLPALPAGPERRVPASAGSPNLYSTQNAVRALAGEALLRRAAAARGGRRPAVAAGAGGGRRHRDARTRWRSTTARARALLQRDRAGGRDARRPC